MRFIIYLIVLILPVNMVMASSGMPPNAVQVDKEEKVPASWRSCQSNTDCVIVNYGCSSDDAIGVNSASEQQAQKRYWEEMGLDPRAMNCIQMESEYIGQPEAFCRNRQCGVWQYLKCLDPPDCTREVENVCTLETKAYPYEDDDTSYGFSATNLYALSMDACKQKCKDTLEKRRKYWQDMNIPKTSAQCFFDDTKIIDNANVMD